MCNFSSRFKGILLTHIEFHETNETTPISEGSSFSHTMSSTFETSLENATNTKVHRRSNRRTDPTCNISTFNEEILKSHVDLVLSSPRGGRRVASGSKGQDHDDMYTEELTRNYCTICDFSSSHKENFTFHMETIHSMSKRRLNNISSMQTGEPRRNRNDLGKNGTIFYCTICDFSTLYKGNLKSHIANVHSSSKTRAKNMQKRNSSSQTSNKPLQFECPSSDLSTIQKTNSKYHVSVVQSPSKTASRHISPIKRQGLRRISSATSEIGSKYYCSICDFSTLYKGNLKTHTIGVHRNSKRAKNAIRSSGRFRRHDERCSTPGASNDEYAINEFLTFRKGNTKTQSNMKMKPENTTNIKSESPNGYPKTSAKTQPNIVQSSSKMKPENTTNIKSESPNGYPKTSFRYYCTICDFSTVYKFNIKPHMKTHATQSKFMCSICDINFGSSETLEKHDKLHFRSYSLLKKEPQLETKEILGLVERSAEVGDLQSRKMFSCTICGNMYSWIHNLKSHLANIHNLTEDNSPRSREPTLTFSSYVQRQEGSSCDICGKRFCSVGNLKRHRVNVHNIQNHFSTRKRIGNSARVSSEQKKVNRKEKFICNICQRVFGFKRHLALHSLAHKSNKKVPLVPNLDSGYNKRCNLSSQQENQDQELLFLKTKTLDSNASPRAEIHLPIESLIDDQSIGVQLSGEKCFFCKLCGSGHSRRYNLITHIRHYHRQSLLIRNSDPRRHTRHSLGRPTDRERHRSSSISSSKETFLCEYCDSYFIHIGRLMRHVKTFHKNMSSEVRDGRAATTYYKFTLIDGGSAQSSNFPAEKIETNTAESKLDSFELFSNDSRDTSNEEQWETSMDTVSESANNRCDEEFENLELDEVDLNVFVQRYLNNCNEDLDFDFGNLPLDCNNRTTSNDLWKKSASNGDLALTAKSEEPQSLSKDMTRCVDENTEETRHVSDQNHSECSQIQKHENVSFRKRQFYVERQECSDDESSSKKCNQRLIFQESRIDWKRNAAKYLGFRECSVHIKSLPKHCSSYVTLG